MIFPERIRMLIEERNLTQKQLAAELAIPSSTLGGYVQGTSEPDFQTLLMIADYFRVSTDYLLGHAPDSTVNPLETDLLRLFRAMPPLQQEIYLEQGRVVARISGNAADHSKHSKNAKVIK